MNKLQLSAYLGFIVGDALGVPYEFHSQGSFQCSGMDGYKSHNQPPGTWSDDTSMLLATIDASNLNQILDNYADWYLYGKYTPFGECFDIGNTMEFILNQYIQKQNHIVTDQYSNGNAPLCRVLPFAFYKNINKEHIYQLTKLTHQHPISLIENYNYYLILKNLINKKDLLNNVNKDIPQQLVNNQGFIKDTLNNAIYCFLNTNNYKDAVLMAVNAGGDTDSTAAITGSFAGIAYGLESIPKEWITALQNKELIYSILKENNK